MHHHTERIGIQWPFFTPVVEHWLKQEIVLCMFGPMVCHIMELHTAPGWS